MICIIYKNKMMSPKITFFFTLFMFSALNAQTTFDWDTYPMDNGDNITETVDGITVTFTGPTEDTTFLDLQGVYGTSGNVVLISPSLSTATEVTFSFSEAVDVNSILALEGNLADIDYTFTPTGGSNTPVVASITGGSATVTLNWTDVTSFTVTSTDAWYGFDSLVINDSTLSADEYTNNDVVVSPNPVKGMLHVSHIQNLRSLKLYNSLGQLVAETQEQTIDLTHFNEGMYLLQVVTDNGITTKRVIKD